MEENRLIHKTYTNDPYEYGHSDSIEDDWDYPSLENDDAIEKFIEEERIQFRREWFRYIEENEVYD